MLLPIHTKVEGGKRASAGQAVEAWGIDACLARHSKTETTMENRVRTAMQLSFRVADGRGSQYTEDEGDESRKNFNSGTGFNIIC